MFFDTHSHLNFSAFAPDLEKVVADARAGGVARILVVGTCPRSNREAVRIAREHDLLAAVGIHPSEAGEEAFDDREFTRLLDDERVVAVGETGLDYTCAVAPERQAAVFRRLLEIAGERARPVIVHSREAAAETLSLLAEHFGPGRQARRGVWHCFSGDARLAGEVVALGLHVSFTGNITYRRNDLLREALAAVPLERLMLETDCPFMPPEGRRGRRNEPAWLPLVLPTVARLKEVTPETAETVLFENSRAFFLGGTGLPAAVPGTGQEQ